MSRDGQHFVFHLFQYGQNLLALDTGEAVQWRECPRYARTPNRRLAAKRSSAIRRISCGLRCAHCGSR